MRRTILLIAAIAAMALSAVAATSLSEARIYINAGHGSWGPNDRPMATIPYPNLSSTGRPDTCGFYESNTNLWKCLKMGSTLELMGAKKANIFYSRVKNGPYPYVSSGTNATKYNRSLTEISEEVCANNIDYFISVHSDAATEGGTANRALTLYRGKDGTSGNYVSGSYARALTHWQNFIGNGIDVCSSTVASPNLRGDCDFYGSSTTRYSQTTGQYYTGYLGVLKHNAPGFLCEGYCHTYQPARHRALNADYCRMEGVRHARGVAAYFNAPGETTGYIMGTVKSKTEKMFSSSLFKYKEGSIDQWLPINGAVVKLYQNGSLKGTYTVDNNYNGVFVFEHLAPGTYQLMATAAGYEDLAAEYQSVTVTANATTYPLLYLTPGEGGSGTVITPTPNTTDYPQPAQDDCVANLEAIDFTAEATDLDIAELQGKTVRRVLQRNGFLWVLAVDAAGAPTLLKIDPATLAAEAISTAGTEGKDLAVSDIAFTADGFLLGCNKGENQDDDDHVATGDTRGTFHLYKWNMSDLTSAPSIIYSTQFAAFYYNAVVGNTLAVSGKTADAQILVSGVTTGSSTGMRFMRLNMVNGVITSSTTAPDYLNVASGATSGFAENLFGADAKLSPSPFNNGYFIIDGSGINATEFMPATTVGTNCTKTDVQSSSQVAPEANGATYFRYANQTLMAAPVVDTSGNNIGFKIFDVSNGLASATEIDINGAALSSGSTSYAAARVDNSDINIYMLRGNKLSRFFFKGVTCGSSEPGGDEPQSTDGSYAVMATNLNVAEADGNYTFTFDANTDARSTQILLYDSQGTLVKTVEAEAATAGTNSVTVAKTDLPYESGELRWAVKLTGDTISAAVKLATVGTFVEGAVAIDNSTESPNFGSIYVNSRSTGSTTGGLYRYDTSLHQNAFIPNTSADQRRIAVDTDGNVYAADWGDASSEIRFYSAADLTQNWNMYNHGSSASSTRDATTGLWSLNGTALGGSCSAVSVVGSGADRKLYVYDEDYQVDGAGNNVIVHNIGTATDIATAPAATIGGAVHTKSINHDCGLIASDDGIWVSQTRAANMNSSYATSFFYSDLAANIKLMASDAPVSEYVTGCPGSGLAVNCDRTLLAVANSGTEITVFDITWSDNTPTLSFKCRFNHDDGYTRNGLYSIFQMAFDRANNLYISGGSLGVYSIPTADNTCTIPAPESMTVAGAAPAAKPVKGVMAYGLDVNRNTDTFDFIFSANEDATEGAIVLTDASGRVIKEFALSEVTAGENTFTVDAEQIPYEYGDLNWAVRLKAAPIAEVTQLATIGSYVHGAVTVDNSTDSPGFGSVYVNSRSTDSATGGLYQYSPMLDQTKFIANSSQKGRRIAVDSDGNVYASDWGDGSSEIRYYSAADLTQNWNMLHHGASASSTRASSGLWSLNGTAIGGSTTSVWVTGSGADRKLYTYDEDYKVNNLGNNVLVYNIGESTDIATAPSKSYGGTIHSLTGSTDVAVVATDRGMWLGQVRSYVGGTNNNTEEYPSLLYVDLEGNVLFNSGTAAVRDLIEGSECGGFAISPDGSLLAINNGKQEVVVFDLTWADNVPSLTYRYKFSHTHGYLLRDERYQIYQMSFDRGGNLYLAGKELGVYALPTAVNETTIAAPSYLTVKGDGPEPADRGIIAYNLAMSSNSAGITFSFKSNIDAFKGEIILFDAAGNELKAVKVDGVEAGDNSFDIEWSEIPDAAKTWGVRLTAGEVQSVTQLAKIGTYIEGAVAIDNSTDSPNYGSIYVNSRSSDSVTGGLYQYSPTLDQTAYISNESKNGRRIAIDTDGNVYASDWGDATSEIRFYSATDLTQNWNMFNHGASAASTRASSGLWSLNGTALGGSNTAVWLTGSGASRQLFTYDEDYQVNGNGNNVLVYAIGNSHEIAAAPDVAIANAIHTKTPNTDCSLIIDTGGIWVSQTRGSGNNNSSAPSFIYTDFLGNLLLSSSQSGIVEYISASPGSGMALNESRTLFASVSSLSEVTVFDVTWDGNVPSLSYKCRFTHDNGFVRKGLNSLFELAFDHADNLYVSGGSLGMYSIPKAVNVTTTLAPSSSRIIKGLKGDINIDGQVDSSDIAALLEMVLQGGEPTYNSDINSDNSLDSSDIAALLEIVLTGY